MYRARRIRWVTFGRHIKSCNGYPVPTAKPENASQNTLLTKVKSSTSLSLDSALCHRTVTAHTYRGPLDISRKANPLHPNP